ncbi:MAG: DUF4142 domain-containing protein [Bacteroidia bacterium]|nr:DUF4142 domain-containing protein [Bacteroidia bacterium]
MKVHYILLVISTLIFFNCRKPDSRLAMNDCDQNFLVMTSHFNRSQIEISNLSSSKANDIGIKQLALRLTKYHQDSQNELDQIANTNSANLSYHSSQKHANMRNALSQLSGKTFDSVYVCHQLKLHLSMLNLIRDEMQYGKNPAFKEYASRLNSQLLVHLNQSDSLSQLFLSTYFRQDI